MTALVDKGIGWSIQIFPNKTFMPSTRRQKAKARKSREMDMMSDLDNLDVMLGNGSDNPKERELASAIEQSSVQGDIEDELYQKMIIGISPLKMINLGKMMSGNPLRPFETNFSQVVSRKGLNDVHGSQSDS